MKRVTVLTPVFNGEKFIRQTIESILSQEGDFDLEYIIKDGGSTDGTLDIINEYKDKCLIISERDTSISEAIRIGMSHSSGDFAGILMADDVYYPGALDKVVKAFEKHKGRRWLYGRCSIIDENSVPKRGLVTAYKNLIGCIYCKNILLCENFINEPATFWHMDLWHELGGWNSKYYRADDYHMWVKMAQVSKAISLRAYLAKFRRHSASISENDYQGQIREELNICKECGNRIHYLIHSFLCRQRIRVYAKLK